MPRRARSLLTALPPAVVTLSCLSAAVHASDWLSLRRFTAKPGADTRRPSLQRAAKPGHHWRWDAERRAYVEAPNLVTARLSWPAETAPPPVPFPAGAGKVWMWFPTPGTWALTPQRQGRLLLTYRTRDGRQMPLYTGEPLTRLPAGAATTVEPLPVGGVPVLTAPDGKGSLIRWADLRFFVPPDANVRIEAARVWFTLPAEATLVLPDGTGLPFPAGARVEYEATGTVRTFLADGTSVGHFTTAPPPDARLR